jgi:hypothetical protein
MPEQKRGFVSTIFLELVFIFGVIVAAVLTLIDIPLGILRFVVISLWNRRPHFPWAKVAALWRVIGAHVSYWFTSAAEQAGVSYDSADDVRARLRGYAVRVVPGGKLPHVDPVDVFQFFALLPAFLWSGIVIVHVVVSTFMVFWLYGVYNYYGQAELRTQPVPEVVETHVPRVDQVQERDFGPWHNRGDAMVRIGDLTFLNLVMISDTGYMMYSDQRIADPSNFIQTPVHERVVNPRLTPAGDIAFRDQAGRAYAVNPNQAFIFAGFASKVFMFDASGNLKTVPAAELKFKN